MSGVVLVWKSIWEKKNTHLIIPRRSAHIWWNMSNIIAQTEPKTLFSFWSPINNQKVKQKKKKSESEICTVARERNSNSPQKCKARHNNISHNVLCIKQIEKMDLCVHMHCSRSCGFICDKIDRTAGNKLKKFCHDTPKKTHLFFSLPVSSIPTTTSFYQPNRTPIETWSLVITRRHDRRSTTICVRSVAVCWSERFSFL